MDCALQASLLIDKCFVEFAESVQCMHCGDCLWKCWRSSKNLGTNALFHLQCRGCGIAQYWLPQGFDGLLNKVLHASTKLANVSPTRLRELLSLLCVGYPACNKGYCGIVKDLLKPTIYAMYRLQSADIVTYLQSVIVEKQLHSASVVWDTNFSSRNNNANFAATGFIELTTGMNYCLHIKTVYCNDEITPH